MTMGNVEFVSAVVQLSIDARNPGSMDDDLARDQGEANRVRPEFPPEPAGEQRYFWCRREAWHLTFQYLPWLK
jgi:hypothetical protein